MMSEQHGFRAPGPGASAASIAAIVGLQALVGGGFALIVALAAGIPAGYSALIGMLVCLLPSALFGCLVSATLFLGLGARIQLHSFYAGELFRLAMTVVLFSVVFTALDDINFLFLFSGFMATQLAMLLALLRG